MIPIQSGGLPRLAAELCLSFLTWEPRIVAREQHPTTALSILARALSVKFRNAFLDEHIDWSAEDFDGVVASPVWQKIHFDTLGLLSTIADGYQVRILVSSQEPVISTACIEEFLELTNVIDADALILSHLTRSGMAHAVDTLVHWGTFPCFSDRELDNLLKRGVGDIHVHFGGARSALGLWQELFIGAMDLRRVRAFRRRGLRNSVLHAAVVNEDTAATRIACVLGDLQSRQRDHIPSTALETAVSIAAKAYGEALGRVSPTRNATDLAPPALRRERYWLSSMFTRLQEINEQGHRDPEPANALDYVVDRYLFAKAQFLSTAKQPLEREKPGLGRFRRYFHSLEPTDRLDRPAKLSPRFENIQLIRRRQLEVADLIKQSGTLKLIELRLSPMPTFRHYVRFFKIWRRIEQDFGFDKGAIEIRFAVHFMRSTDRYQRARQTPATGDNSAGDKFRRELDARSATLHLLRMKTMPAARDFAARIARIDLAGQERDMSVLPAVVFMNLLRGVPGTLAQLEGEVCPSTHRHWLYAKRRGLARQPPHARPLGVTCHAGEDMAHPLEGVCDMACAVEFLQMGAGDTLGHGLAAGWDISKFAPLRGRQSITRRGRQFDSLLWLHRHLMTKGIADFSVLFRLENWLRREAKELYAVDVGDLASLHDVFGARAGCVVAQNRTPVTLVDRILALENWSLGCQSFRALPIPLDPILTDLGSAITATQRATTRTLIELGIVLEFNPSSNLRITGIADVGAAPFVNLIKQFGESLLAAIGTDDPGVFGTRIENEYALLLHGLAKCGLGRSEAFRIVDRIRKVTLGEHERPIAV